MSRVMFLSEATLKAESVLQDNVSMKIVAPTIYDVQNYFILPILGTSLYNEISDQIAASAVTSLNRTLLDTYITPTMLWYCRFELPMNMNYKYFNKAVGVQNADNMTPASIEEIAYITDRAKNKAEWYAERLTKYLLQNQTLYPLYLNQTDVGIDTIFPTSNNYTSGMSLGNPGCGDCRGQYNFQNIPIAPRLVTKPCTYCD